MSSFDFPNAIQAYNKLIEDYLTLERRGGPVVVSIRDNIGKAVQQFTSAVYQELSPEIRSQLIPSPAYSSLRDPYNIESAIRSKDNNLGRIIFYSSDDRELVKVALRFSHQNNDITFIFERSANSVANEIIGALQQVAPH